MTGAYYDFLYLGYKVVFFDYGYELSYSLPIVSSINNYDDLVNVIENGLFEPNWKHQADKVLKECLNLSVKKIPRFTIPELINEQIC